MDYQKLNQISQNIGNGEDREKQFPTSPDKKVSNSSSSTNSKLVNQNANNCSNRNPNEFSESINANSNGTCNLNNSSNQINNNSVTDSLSLSSPSSLIKKKSSSFLHRDYNRKPILARSQVSMKNSR